MFRDASIGPPDRLGPKHLHLAVRASYVSAEKSTIEDSLPFDRMISFCGRFHTVDVLLVDDIEVIAGYERT